MPYLSPVFLLKLKCVAAVVTRRPFWLGLLAWLLLSSLAIPANTMDLPTGPLRIGEQATDGWVLINITEHEAAEFQRYWFAQGEERVVVEVIIDDGVLRIMPAPGETLPGELETWLEERLADWDFTDTLVQKTGVGETRAWSPRSLFVTWGLLALGALGLGLFCYRFRRVQWVRWCGYAGAIALGVCAFTTVSRPVAVYVIDLLSIPPPAALAIVPLGWAAVSWLQGSRPSVNREVWVPLLAIALVVGAVLSATQPAFSLLYDGTRDLLIGADCLTGTGCDLGTPANFGRLRQGTLWPRTAAWLVIGLDAPSWVMTTFVALLHTFAVVGVFLATKQFASRNWSLAASAVQLVLIAHLIPAQEFTNHTAVPFYAALMAWLLLRFARTGRSTDCAGLAFFVLLTIESHVAAWWMFGPALLTVIVLARRPFLSGLVFFATFALLATSLSPASLSGNLSILGFEWLGPVWLCIWFIGSLVFGLSVRPMFRPDRSLRRTWFVLGLWLVAFFGMLAVVLTLRKGFQTVYLLSVTPLLAAAVGGASAAFCTRVAKNSPSFLDRWSKVVLPAVLLAACYSAATTRSRSFNTAPHDTHLLTDYRSLAKELNGSGCFADIAERIRSVDNWGLTRRMAPFLNAPCSPNAPEISIVRVSPELWAQAGPGWDSIVSLGGWRLAFRTIRSIVDQSTVRYCVQPEDGEAHCEEGNFDYYRDTDRPQFSWDRASPVFTPSQEIDISDATLRFRLSLRDDISEAVTLRFAADAPGCAWQIRATSGVESQMPFAQGSITIDSVSGQDPWIEVERAPSEVCTEDHVLFPPGFFEVGESDAFGQAVLSWWQSTSWSDRQTH